MAGRCPECGDAVACSIPDEERSRAAPAGPARQLLAVVFARPLKTARPRSEMQPARALVVGGYARVCLLIAPIVMALFLYPEYEPDTSIEELVSTGFFASAILCLGLALWFAQVMALGFLWSWRTNRLRDPRVAAVVGMYCTALLHPIVWLNTGCVLWLYLAAEFGLPWDFLVLPFLGEVDMEHVLLGAWVVLNCTLLGWFLIRMYRHVHDARYCNS
jgi:hypothetical protein